MVFRSPLNFPLKFVVSVVSTLISGPRGPDSAQVRIPFFVPLGFCLPSAVAVVSVTSTFTAGDEGFHRNPLGYVFTFYVYGAIRGKSFSSVQSLSRVRLLATP